MFGILAGETVRGLADGKLLAELEFTLDLHD